MSNIYAEALTLFVHFLMFFVVLTGAGYVLVQIGRMAADTWKRGLAAVGVFMVLFFIVYLDAGYVSDVHFLAAVIGGGCCWIGSNKR